MLNVHRQAMANGGLLSKGRAESQGSGRAGADSIDLEGAEMGGRELGGSNRMNPTLDGIRPATWNMDGVASTQGMEKSASRTTADFQETCTNKKDKDKRPQGPISRLTRG